MLIAAAGHRRQVAAATAEREPDHQRLPRVGHEQSSSDCSRTTPVMNACAQTRCRTVCSSSPDRSQRIAMLPEPVRRVTKGPPPRTVP